jgi:hypothetical protein
MCIEQISNIVLVIATLVLAIATWGLWRATTHYTEATKRLEKITRMNVVDNILRVVIGRAGVGTHEAEIYPKYINHLTAACKNRNLIPENIPCTKHNEWVKDKVIAIHANLFIDLLIDANANQPEELHGKQ